MTVGGIYNITPQPSRLASGCAILVLVVVMMKMNCDREEVVAHPNIQDWWVAVLFGLSCDDDYRDCSGLGHDDDDDGEL